jgi:hypothetical protein
MSILEQKFETIEVVGQDSTGFEDSSTYSNVSLKEIEGHLPEEYLKEIHLINPIKS